MKAGRPVVPGSGAISLSGSWTEKLKGSWPPALISLFPGCRRSVTSCPCSCCCDFPTMTDCTFCEPKEALPPLCWFLWGVCHYSKTNNYHTDAATNVFTETDVLSCPSWVWLRSQPQPIHWLKPWKTIKQRFPVKCASKLHASYIIFQTFSHFFLR